MTAQTIRKFHQFKRAMEIAIEMIGVETPITTITIGDRQGEATYTLPPEIVWSSTNAGILKWMTEKYEQKTLTSMSGWQGFFSQWQECIGEKVELFWKKIEEEGLPLKRSNRLHWIIKKGKTTHGHEIEMLLEGVEELRKSKIYYQVYSADEIKKIDAIVADSIAIIKERMNNAINRGRFRDFRESGSYGANLTLLHKSKLFRDAFTEYEQHTAETFYEKHKIVW